VERLAGLARDQVVGSARLARRVIEVPLSAAAHPLETAQGVARIARGLGGALADAARAPVRDPLAVAGSGLSRRLDVATVSLERLRKIKAPLGVSINDVVLTALAGTLRAYHRERRVHAEELVCMVPMNLRGRDERDTLGNRVGMFNILLPVGEARPDRRLARIVEQTRAAKADRRGAAAPFLVEALTLLPGGALRWLAQHALGRVNVACTNVPGVPMTRWMAGARVEAMYPFASVVEGTPLVVALLSYGGDMQIGIDTDPEAIPDPHRIATLFEEALAELERLSEGSGAR
jgi:diacylglycerol O-acyltransferase